MLSAYRHKNGGEHGFSLGGMIIFTITGREGDAFRIYTQKRRDKEREYMYTKRKKRCGVSKGKCILISILREGPYFDFNLPGKCPFLSENPFLRARNSGGVYIWGCP